MTPQAATYLAKVIAMGERPLLSDLDARGRFYSQIRSSITRQINYANKGKATEFSLPDLQALYAELTILMDGVKNDRRTSEA